MIDVQLYIPGHEEIDISIAIIVGPRSPSAEASTCNTGPFRVIFKFAITEIMVEHIVSEACDIDVRQSVVIIICNSHTHPPTLPCKSSSLGDISEREICSLAVERKHQVTSARSV